MDRDTLMFVAFIAAVMVAGMVAFMVLGGPRQCPKGGIPYVSTDRYGNREIGCAMPGGSNFIMKLERARE